MDEFKDDRNARFSSPVSHKAIYWMADSDWTAGYFTNLDDAINAVKNNELDVFEHCYNYAVIEAFFIAITAAIVVKIKFKTAVSCVFAGIIKQRCHICVK